eukprot:SAG22_NODE_187_length_15860_cov_44.770446_16_plen_68_part_00
MASTLWWMVWQVSTTFCRSESSMACCSAARATACSALPGQAVNQLMVVQLTSAGKLLPGSDGNKCPM